MVDLIPVDNPVDEENQIDIQEVLQDTRDGLVDLGGDKLISYFKAQDQYLDAIGIRVGDNETLDTEVYLSNPLLAGLWCLGQFREIAADIEEHQELQSYMALLSAWEEIADHILEMG